MAYIFIRVDQAEEIVGIRSNKSHEENIFLSVYPNPFSTSVNIDFNIDQAEEVNITVYDLYGRLVKSVFKGSMLAGDQTLSWDGRNEQEKVVKCGMYIINCRIGKYLKSKRIVYY